MSRSGCICQLLTGRLYEKHPFQKWFSLPAEDQLQLVLSNWTPMLVLGMAPEPSMPQKILTSSRQGKYHIAHDQSVQGVPLTDVQLIKMFLNKCWEMDISNKEYAYLKGAILFNPDIAELQCQNYIQALQREAHQALNEYVKMVHRGDAIRFNKLSVLRSINSKVVAGLFFKPVIGSVSMEDLLLQMFYR
uniref:NR LBD domain-containing protein n=1 Tax=Esox lucius TaxID=8010 RepID=A0A3P8Z625_ESOLU